MRKKIYPYLSLFILALGLCGLFPQNPSVAQTTSFAGVVPFSTSGGYVGFFEQNSGKVYIYDDKLTDCVQISQIQQLGEPTLSLKSQKSETPTLKFIDKRED
jgi:hypothetical protein